MKQAALLFNRPQADLYRENSGRIPIWAWQQPHHMESFISTPISDLRSADPITGEVKFSVKGVDVTIRQDGRDPSVSGAQTRLHFDPGSISRHLGGNHTDFLRSRNDHQAGDSEGQIRGRLKHNALPPVTESVGERRIVADKLVTRELVKDLLAQQGWFESRNL